MGRMCERREQDTYKGGWQQFRPRLYHRLKGVFPCYKATLRASQSKTPGFGLYADGTNLSARVRRRGKVDHIGQAERELRTEANKLPTMRNPFR